MADLYGAGRWFAGDGIFNCMGSVKRKMNKMAVFILLTVVVAVVFFLIQLYGSSVN